MGRKSLIDKGLNPQHVHCIRRGLEKWPTFKQLRPDRSQLHLVCVARLVAKKGLHHQLEIYAALQKAGVDFEAHIVGGGDLLETLKAQAARLGLSDKVRFTGHLAQPQVWEQFAWADALLHTGIIAPSGDRDGLPNVIPEAMAAGVLVVTSPAAATTEAITHEQSGLVAEVDQPEAWVSALLRYQSDDLFCERLRKGARAWIETNYNAHTNAARLHGLFQESLRNTQESRIQNSEFRRATQ
jgi:glycosyltransferase involved in cell wall biosynthesis